MESGRLVKIKNMGVPYINGYGKGDLYVELKLVTPKNLTSKQRKAIEGLKKEGL